MRDRILLGINYFQGRQNDVTLPNRDRVTHSSLIGKTGTGKSTLLGQLVHQDIRSGSGVGIIDPHGELANRILATSIPPEREQDIVLLDMTDGDFPVGLNLLDAPASISPQVVAGQALSVLRKLFADNWSSTRMEDALYAALTVLMTAIGTTIQDVHRVFHDSGFRAQLLRRVTDPIALEFWHDEYETSSDAMQREIARPISNRIRRFYRNIKIRRVVCQTNSLDFREILDSGKIFIANLGGLTDIEAEVLGALLISKFQMAAMSRSLESAVALSPFYLHIDEVQNFVTTSLPKVLSEARKYELRLNIAHQHLSQLKGNTLDAMMGNVGTNVIFGVGIGDANTLAPYVQPQFNARDLVSLDRFAAVVKMQEMGQTQPAFSMKTLPPSPLPAGSQRRIEHLRGLSRFKYARHKDLVDADLLQRYGTYRRPQDTPPGEPDDDNYFG